MAAETQDRLDLARARFRTQISTLESELSQLRTKLAVLDEVAQSRDLVPVVTGERGSKYAGVGLTEALESAVKEVGQEPFGAQATELRKHIIANGYGPVNKNIVVSTITALNRLVKQGRIKTEMRQGMRFYMT